jgi:oxygen-independent coproporphyrinogen-3 oxidase
MPSLLEPPVQTCPQNYFVSNYPPFSCWSADKTPKLLHALSRPAKAGPLGLYVHLPFCRQRCHYCYFRVHPQPKRHEVDRYIDCLLAELEMYRKFPALQLRGFDSVYFGGGTPSFAEVDQIERLFRGLQARTGWDAVEECTFECEPGTVTPEKLRALKNSGVTRLSLGFQTLDDEVIRRNGRRGTKEECRRSFERARLAGFDQINIDLLAGLPGETEESWQDTIHEVLDLAPDCITIYQLELTYNSTLYYSIQGGRNVSLPSWPIKRQWVKDAFEACEQMGYTIGSGYMAIRDPAHWRFVYTVEHFWHGADLVALGETAFGHIQGVHYQNADTYEEYCATVAAGRLPIRRAYLLNSEEKFRREVILQLKTGALDADHFRKKFDIDLADRFEPQFKELLEEGLLEIDGNSIRLTREGLLEVDWLLPRFYLSNHVGIRYT